MVESNIYLNMQIMEKFWYKNLFLINIYWFPLQTRTQLPDTDKSIKENRHSPPLLS